MTDIGAISLGGSEIAAEGGTSRGTTTSRYVARCSQTCHQLFTSHPPLLLLDPPIGPYRTRQPPLRGNIMADADTCSPTHHISLG